MSARHGIEPDHYAVLGISHDAGADDVKRAFRAVAKRYHPDSNPDDPQAQDRFSEVMRAYQVLSDEETRATYDRRRTITAGWNKAVGWYKDPYAQHEIRWISNGVATSLVRDGDVTSFDVPTSEPVVDTLVEADYIPAPHETTRAGDGTDPEMDGVVGNPGRPRRKDQRPWWRNPRRS